MMLIRAMSEVSHAGAIREEQKECRVESGRPRINARLLENRLVDLKVRDSRGERPPRQAAHFGAAPDVPVALLQRLADVLPLDVCANLLQ